MIQVPAALPTSEGCADPSKLVGICNTVRRQSDPPPGRPYNYMYEQQMEEAACVRPGDSEEVVSAKVRRMWKQLEDPYLKCNVADFDVAFGNVLKYSFAGRNFDGAAHFRGVRGPIKPCGEQSKSTLCQKRA
jgi:hypothetical protein